MTEIKLKCGFPVCDYVTEEVSVEIAWGLLQFHRQAREVSLKIKEEVKGFKRVPMEVNLMPREAVVDGCRVCMVGEAMVSSL